MKLPFKPLKPPVYTAAAAILRRLSTEAHPLLPSLEELSSTASRLILLLRSTEPSSWSGSPNFQTLISSLSPPSVLRIARKLPNFQHAMQFLDCIRAVPQPPASVSVAFQAVLELSMRENADYTGKFRELFELSRDQSIPISVNAAALLIKCFGRAKMLDEMKMVVDAVDEEMMSADLLNLVVVGYLKWGRIDDALKVLDDMFLEDSRYHPNNNTATVVISSFLRMTPSGRRGIDEEICNLIVKFRKHGICMDGSLLTPVILRLCKNGELDKAWVVLHKVVNRSSDSEVVCYNALLTGFGRRCDFNRMNLLMKEMMEKGIQPNVITYGIMIKHLCKLRRIDEALKVLEKMTQREVGVELDVVIYNTLIDGLCKVGRLEEGMQLMDRMRSEGRCNPNTVTYNCLIDGFCKVGEIEKAHELFEEMGKEGVMRSVVTLNTLLDGMCKNERVGSAMQIFCRMQEQGLKGNVATYTTLMVAFCNVNNIGKVMELFYEMRENGLYPDAMVFHCLIAGLSQAGKMDSAMDIVSKMKEAGFSLDIIGYNNLISGFCKRNKLDKASKLLEDMEKAGLKPDHVTYNTLLSFFCSKGDFSHAHGVMRDMINSGIRPTVVTYGALISAYCSKVDLDSAMRLFKDMNLSSKVRPNTVIYNMLIDAHCKKDNIEVALSLINDMKDKGVMPNTTTYNALFKGLKQRNWFEKALEYMNEMTQQACHPDYITMEILTEWLSTVGEVEKLKKFVEGHLVSASSS